jgi:TolA-binding protein
MRFRTVKLTFATIRQYTKLPMQFRSLSKVVVLLCLSACWLPLETGKQMQADLTALQEEVLASKKRLAEQQARLDDQMQRIDEKMQDFNRAASLSDADFGVQLEKLVKDTQELRGQSETAIFRLDKLEEKLGKMPETAVKDAREPQSSGHKNKDELFEAAEAMEKDSRFADARGVYRDITKRWPTEPGVADLAYFRLGETYFKEKRFRDAMPSYIKIVEQFENGNFADKAYYQIGLSSLELGNFEDAQIFFNEIVTRYKKSPLFKDATSKLADVKKRLAQEKKRPLKSKAASKK